MAKFTFTFEDTESGGMKGSVELKGFLDSQESNKDNTPAQDLYFAINRFINDIGIPVKKR